MSDRGEADKLHRSQTSATARKPVKEAVRGEDRQGDGEVDGKGEKRSTAEDEGSVGVTDWSLVDRKRKGKKIIHGTAEQAGKFAAAERKAWFFVGRVRDGVNVQDIQNYVEGKLPGQKVDCEKLSTLGTSGCFKVGVSFDEKVTLEQESFWPRGVKVKQFRFFRGQPSQVTKKAQKDQVAEFQ